MEYRSLGRTGVQVSELCLGCMMFGGRTEPEDSYAIIDKAIEAGINFLDTANVYSRGRSEEVTGEALKRNGKRDIIILATKVHGRMDDDDPNGWGNTRRHIIKQCEASLKRLNTDYIDLYQIHRPQSEVPIDETLRALDDLISAGKVRYIGSSTFAAWQLVESLWIAKELGLNRFICEQQPYNILDRRVERELMPMAQTYGFATIPWSPLAGGLLTGKYKRGWESPDDARYADVEDKPWMAKRRTEGVFDVTEGLEPLVAEKGVTMAQFALAWVLAQPGVTSPIIGPRTMEQLEDNLGALEVEITAADQAKVDELVPPGLMVAPFYDADFGPHPYRL
ncbi:MAG: aldo/keto reductase [Anaerolineales bacterium]|nr:aldo/keto reductase [Anaerolineales bacterium]